MPSRFVRAIRALIEPDPSREDPGSIDWHAIYPAHDPGAIAEPATPLTNVRAVAASTSPRTLAQPNPRRSSLTISNDSTATLYVKLGPVAAPVAGGYTVKLGPGATYMIESPGAWQGEVSGVWSAVNGAAAITETGPDGR